MDLALRRAASVLWIVALLTLGACGDDDEPSREPTTTSTTTLSGAAVEALSFAAADEPGCAVSATVDGEPVAAAGFGLADLATGEELTAESTFDIASVSKQFTAAAVYLLEQDGELSVDDEIHDYLPELPDYGTDIVLDDLIHHTSGLTDYTALLGERFDDTDLTTTEDALDALVTVPDLTFEPGTEFEYNNSNYFLLGLAVERVSGESLAEFLEAEVFSPLGMEDTVVRDDADLVVPHGAEGYAADGAGGFEPNTTNWEQVGDGSVWSSVVDLQRWAENLRTWEVGGEDLEAAMLEPGAADGEGAEYGGGLTLADDGTLEHSGAWAGFTLEFVVDPGAATSVVVLCNRDDVDPTALAEEILAVID